MDGGLIDPKPLTKLCLGEPESFAEDEDVNSLCHFHFMQKALTA